MRQTRDPNSTTARLLLVELSLFAAAILLSGPGARAQLKHEGPAKLIGLSQTVTPYDVVSVHINNSGASSYSLNFQDERLIARNIPIEYVIEFAYDVPPDRVTGISAAFKDRHFDIEAKVVPADGSKPPETSASQDQAKLILLLADRFHLRVHVESKIMPVYDLVVTKSGPKVTLSQDELKDSNWNVSHQDTSLVLTSKATSMADLAAALSDQVHRPITDKTGLTGHADITLKWTDDVAAEQGGPNLVSVFTAVEEQLGLKLVSSKGPVDTLVIDHLEMPSEN